MKKLLTAFAILFIAAGITYALYLGHQKTWTDQDTQRSIADSVAMPQHFEKLHREVDSNIVGDSAHYSKDR